MNKAILQAKIAFSNNEVPIGAVVVRNNEVIGLGYNTRESNNNTLGHAEINAIIDANQKLNSWKLDDCDIYITCEPCIMCSGAIIQSRIKNVYYGCKDSRNGCAESLSNIFQLNFTHKVSVSGGYLEEECSKLLSDFFKNLRK